MKEKNFAWMVGSEIFVEYNFSEEYLQDCRNIEGRRWNATEKVNVFPFTAIVEFKMLADKWGIRLSSQFDNFKLPDFYTGTGRKYQVTQEGDKLVICFDFNAKMIEAIRSLIPAVKWDFLNRIWKAPMESTLEVIKFALTYKLTVSPDLVPKLTETLEHITEMRRASESLNAEMEIPGIAIDLLPYQKAGVAYLKKVRKGILGDQPGLGKTAQAIATIASENQFPVIVVCPNTLKINWKREVQKFFPKLGVSILNGGKSEEIPKSDVIIVNYDILYNRNDDIIKHGFKALIVDESHAIKNGQRKNTCPECKAAVRSNTVNCPVCKVRGIKPVESWTVKRTQAVIRLARLLGPRDFVLLLTGTPITNRPDELIPQLEAVGRLDNFGGAWRFKSRYAPKRNVALNTQELNEKLRELCFVRRIKKDVYGDLPPLRNAVQYLDVDKESMDWYKTVENDAVEYFANRARELAIEEGSDGTTEYWHKKITLEHNKNLIKITALRTAVSKIKYETTVSWIDNFLESGDGEKVIIFAEHIDFVEKLFERYKDVAVKIRGGVSVPDRQKAVDKFQNDPTCRVFIANMTSASEGLTLTAASDVVFCELGWTPAIHEQCVSRAYGRVNDMHGATAWYLLAPQTIDEDVYSLLDKKRAVVDSVTDGIVNNSEGEGSVVSGLVKRLAERGMER